MPSTLLAANTAPIWWKPSATNGRLMAGSSAASGSPVTRETSIDTPVTPPSMNPLETRKPLMPMAADRMPAAMSAAFSSSRRKGDLNGGSVCGP